MDGTEHTFFRCRDWTDNLYKIVRSFINEIIIEKMFAIELNLIVIASVMKFKQIYGLFV